MCLCIELISGVLCLLSGPWQTNMRVKVKLFFFPPFSFSWQRSKCLCTWRRFHNCPCAHITKEPTQQVFSHPYIPYHITSSQALLVPASELIQGNNGGEKIGEDKPLLLHWSAAAVCKRRYLKVNTSSGAKKSLAPCVVDSMIHSRDFSLFYCQVSVSVFSHNTLKRKQNKQKPHLKTLSPVAWRDQRELNNFGSPEQQQLDLFKSSASDWLDDWLHRVAAVTF